MRKFISIIFSLGFSAIQCCKFIDIQSEALGSHRFAPLPETVSQSAGIVSGRTAFSTSDGPALFLYHILSDPAADGVGRWVINDQLGSMTNALSYVDSWAVLPHLVKEVNDIGGDWMSVSDGNWVIDPEFQVFCVYDDENGDGVDSTVYFESWDSAIALSGFYLETIIDNEETSYEGPIYAHVKAMDADEQLFLYKHTDKWIIGDSSTIGTDNGMAFVVDDAPSAHLIKSDEWNFVANGSWQIEYAKIISATADLSVYAALREHRSIKYIPNGQKVVYLRNGMAMPVIGLGTGALARETANITIDTALRLGYRSLDLAREYTNEEIVQQVLQSYRESDASDGNLPLPYRDDMFLITKVWPTHLGFFPTALEVLRSMDALKSNYVDLYYLHWPSCNPEIEWMHCHSTVDPEGNWIESWHALEKAYAEGRVNSIGASNFNIELLQHLEDIATVRPHAVQNFAQLGELDWEVRRWCALNNAVYQPYASQRHMNNVPAAIQPVLQKVAADHNVTVQGVSVRFFAQTGASVIPRSTDENHLKSNLAIFDWELTQEEMKALGWDTEEKETDADTDVEAEEAQ